MREHEFWGYEVLLIYAFEAIEYLKGEADRELHVYLSSGPEYHLFPDVLGRRTEQEAHDLAEAWAVRRSGDVTAHEDAILLLLRRQDDNLGKGFGFLHSEIGRGPYPILGETWLAPTPTGTYSVRFEADETSEISLADLKARLEDLHRLVDRGEGIRGYEECVEYVFYEMAYVWKQLNSEEGVRELSLAGWYYFKDDFYHSVDMELESGLSANSTVHESESWRIFLGPFAQRWIEGRDQRLFAFERVAESDQSIDRLYTTRPLPQGEYRFYYNFRRPELIPCVDETRELKNDSEWVVTVTAPDGTVHEAFFDPLAQGPRIGAGPIHGILEPASISLNDSGPVNMTELKWYHGTVTMEFDTRPLLGGHHVDFIALDGSVVLRLSFDDAAEAPELDDGSVTLGWGVCDQPWGSGDLLMLRISQSEPGLGGANNNPDCLTFSDTQLEP